MRVRTKQSLLIVFVIIMGVFVGQTFAQAETERLPLTIAAEVSGVLDEDNLIQVYSFNATSDVGYSLTIATADEAALAAVVTSVSGLPVAQANDTDGDGTLTVDELVVDTTGVYYITVLQVPSADALETVNFTLVLDALASAETTEAVTPAPTVAVDAPEVTETVVDTGQVLTTQGIQVSLTWETNDDLDLEIRDPVGGSLYWQTPTVNSGGTIGPNVNQGCVDPTADSPTETAQWTPGGVPTGSYEVLIYFQQACEGTDATSFTVNITIDGVALTPIQASLLPSQSYVASFTLYADGTEELNPMQGLTTTQQLPIEPSEAIANASPVFVDGGIVIGTITNNLPYQSYSFTGEANQVLSIGIQAISGSLDTYLALLDSAGNIIAFNDDQSVGITDSLIQNVLLPNNGTYTIVATRYAKALGGTEGDFELSVYQDTAQIPEAFTSLPRGTLEFRLLWSTNADLQLLVRDPSGEAIYDDNLIAASGGQLAAQGNINCRTAEAGGAPYSYLLWPANVTPRPGTYEVEVWYQNDCADTTPVNFNLGIAYNGLQIFNENTSFIMGQRYLMSFTILADGSVQVSDAGIIRGIQDIDYMSILDTAIPLTAGSPVSGSIEFANKFDLYVFDGNAGDVINVTMINTSGTLDPYLYLLGPSGNVVAENDDIVAGEDRNSAIANITLSETGQYIIIATHFGGRYGGTIGNYQLTFSQ